MNITSTYHQGLMTNWCCNGTCGFDCSSIFHLSPISGSCPIYQVTYPKFIIISLIFPYFCQNKCITFHLFLLFRLIQEEKESTEQRADELEIRVGSGSLAGGSGGWRGPAMGGGMMGVCYERSTSPPLLVASSSSGRSTPTAHGQHPTRSSPYGAASQSSRDGMQKYHTVSGSSSFKACKMGKNIVELVLVDIAV